MAISLMVISFSFHVIKIFPVNCIKVIISILKFGICHCSSAAPVALWKSYQLNYDSLCVSFMTYLLKWLTTRSVLESHNDTLCHSRKCEYVSYLYVQGASA